MPEQNREIRLQRARQLIINNPKLGKDSINKQLQEEFGVGLRRIDVAKLKAEVLLPNLTLVEKRYNQLIKDGFLPIEAKELSAEPITSPVMEKYRQERKKERAAMNKAGTSIKNQNSLIKADYIFEGYAERKQIKPLLRYADFVSRYNPAMLTPLERKDKMDIQQKTIYEGWRKAGFSTEEAYELTMGKGGTQVNSYAVYNSDAGRKARLDRKVWIDMLLKRGWTLKQIKQEIDGYYYRDSKRSPFDFLKKHESPTRGKRVLKADFVAAIQNRAKEKTNKLYRRVR
jgi:hypothetical protein